MASETRYLTVMDAIGLHARMMMAMGATPAALRDEGALESALMRPQMAAHYERADLATQVALLITGLALAHPFVDGNKRTAFLCGVVFLQLNGLWLDAPGTEAGEEIVAMLTRPDAAEDATAHFAGWLRGHIRPLASEG
jgi:death on curing protein